MSEIQFWKNKEKKLVDPTIFSTKAEELAIQFAKENQESQGRRANKRTQIRKFFDEVQRLSTRASSKEDEWENILPYVHMLVAKAAYAKGRNLVSDNFMKFIRSSIEQVQTPEDLMVFSDFFESLMGFYRQHGPSN